MIFFRIDNGEGVAAGRKRSDGFKVLASIFAGILCFFLSKYHISLQGTGFEIDIPWTLIFPLVIALAYGFRYALLAGMFGGAIYPFYLWPSNGWGNVLSFFYIMVLFGLIGIYADYRDKKSRKYSLFFMKLLFAILYSLFLYICLVFVYNYFLSMNPAFWYSESVNSFSSLVLHQFFVKDIINFSLLVVFCDALANMVHTRQLLGLPIKPWMRNNTMVFLISFSIPVLIWLIIYFVGSFILSQEMKVDSGFDTLSFFILFWSGGILGRVMIWYQERSLKSKDELIFEKQRAEESDRLKSAFLANMSHEIRTPMNGIVGFTSLLNEPGLTGEEQQKYIDIITKSGARMLDTVNDIIEISKIETGQVKVSVKDVDLNERIENLILFFYPEAEGKGVKLMYDNPGSIALIRSDENKLNSILTNLIKNALKFTNNGWVRITCKKTKESIDISVTDTGIGIPLERQQAVFNRFEQADIEDENAFEGSGLGLAITQSYVEMLGGTISLQSEPDIGSVFTVSFPANIIVKQILEEPVLSVVENREDLNTKLNILISEDDENSYYHLSILVKKYANEIIRKKNGKETVEYCRGNSNIDLILMDMKMPVMDGYQATKEIREFNKDVIIVAQTAYALENDRLKAIDAGCNDYITKPIKTDLLNSTLHKYFNLN